MIFDPSDILKFVSNNPTTNVELCWTHSTLFWSTFASACAKTHTNRFSVQRPRDSLSDPNNRGGVVRPQENEVTSLQQITSGFFCSLHIMIYCYIMYP